MELKTQDGYIPFLLFKLQGYILLIPILLCFISKDTWPVAVIIAIVISMFRTKRTFTETIRLDGPLLEVTYMQLFIKRKRQFNIADTVLVLRDHYDVRFKRMPSPSSWFSLLDIVENNKVKFQISTKEGYSKDDMLTFMTAFANKKAQLSIKGAA